MKEISLKIGFYNTTAILQLGQKYMLIDSHGRGKSVTFIRTGKKGFNFLSNKNKCILKRPIYQKKSAEKTIRKNQEYFEMNLPSWLRRVYELNEENNPLVPPVKKPIVYTRNALYRIELEEV